MGGYRSGRPSFRLTCGVMKRLDIRWFRRQGYLRPGYRGSVSWSYNGEPSGSISFLTHENGIQAKYWVEEYGEERQNFDYLIQTTSTPCHFGGSRPWFRCPRCYERVGVLYMRSAVFRCRQCAQVHYECQGETRWARARRQAEKISNRLHTDEEYYFVKPRGMHWKTFNRLCDRYQHYENTDMEGLARLLDHIEAKARK